MKGWQKPKTTKLYINPPKAERMIMLWPDFKVVNSVVKRDQRQGAEDAHGFILVEGPGDVHIPWQESQMHIREDGIPIHKLEYSNGDLIYYMESFCSMDRIPVTYTRITVQNRTRRAIHAQLSLIPRSGRETELMGMNSDGYCSYEPRVELWGMRPSNWSMSEHTIRNDVYSILLQANEHVKMSWSGAEAGVPYHLRHVCKMQFEAGAESKTVIDIALAPGEGQAFDYNTAKRLTEKGWAEELALIQNVPQTDSPYYRRMFLHLISQMLQMIVSHEGESYTAVRQGGIERGIWPTEAVEYLVGLDMVGLYDHSNAVYEYFYQSQIKEGEDKGNIPSMIAPDWASNTGATLWGLSQHLVHRGDQERFSHFRQMLMDGYEWIERTRLVTTKDAYTGPGRGLFPPMSATDWVGANQSWCWTDAWNIMGLEQLAKAFAIFDDPAASVINQSYEQYMQAMKKILGDLTHGRELDEEIAITNRLGLAPTEPPWGPYHGDGPANLIRAGVIHTDSVTLVQVENYLRNRGLMRNGLCGLMTDSLILQGHAGDKWAGHTWYTSYAELCWFFAWLKRKEFHKAEETFQALVKYGMTEEFYIAERYADNDPTFAPWQPNGSGNGRMLMMMFAYFKEMQPVQPN
ncbi:hypothetical protein [Paenibacillus eucommiae]|uniref:Alpha-L-rhamnosidase six-hairpin glycosidase domain-containing protein n=1 Tax=Paenibacillus eucommiae TaxID=1355755 RepID=A0ABS4IRV1_9BACL|nr:hypothetical protein [Paenibacillus eucommiae]MBP1990309.1 hypothetical protein [Paenibacillus eucommiae]